MDMVIISTACAIPVALDLKAGGSASQGLCSLSPGANDVGAQDFPQ
jgi:hypothetical protein